MQISKNETLSLLTLAAFALSSCGAGGSSSGSSKVLAFQIKSDSALKVAARNTRWQRYARLLNNLFPSAQAVPTSDITITKALATLSEIKFSGVCGINSSASSSSTSSDNNSDPIVAGLRQESESSSNASESSENSSAGESENETEHASNECEMEFKGPFEVDLLSTDTTPLVSGLAPDAQWDRVRWKSFKKEHGDDEDLSGRSLYLEAQVGTVAITFESQESFVFEKTNLLGLNKTDIASYRFEVPLSEILSNIDFSGLDPVLNINESNPVETGSSRCPSINNSAHTLYDCLVDGMKNNTREHEED